ncbi:MAG: Gfo/Idh/MocA family oxidoreductase [Planctomycetaceae bacterium]|nr:Gfo/Idh/MocA family oxidoreductase [Planctomycetaceae bacterium]
MANQASIPRRRFLQQSGGLAAAAWLTGSLGAAQRVRGAAPSDQIRIGHIGVGNQGGNNLKALLQQTVAVCDVDSTRLAAARERVEKANGGTCAAFSDYRRLLDRPDIDAVVVTVPDHWHAQITVDACRAGKDVYCEKPLSLTIADGRAMVDAARQTSRIVQTGSQQRSDARFRLACELVRSGRLGKIHTVRAGIADVNFKGPAVADSAPPPELDYNFWLGPAPDRPYNAKRVHYNFRFFWDYSGGQLTNWGAHNLDIAQWGLGMDESGPAEISGRARYHAQGWYEVPEWSEIVYKYADGVTVLCGQDYPGGTEFEGPQGKLHVNRKQIRSDPPELLEQALTESDVHLAASADHHANWLDAIRTRQLPICDVAIGHRSATVCHLGNIAIRTGRTIRWDPEREAIVGDDAAQAMVGRPYRSPWSLDQKA